MLKLDKLKCEVKDLDQKILDECQNNRKVSDLYKGCIIFISPLNLTPDVLFLGINPGSGHYDKHNERIQQFEPYQNQDSGYGLWKHIETCFAKIGKQTYLDTIVKTNVFFLSTKNQTTLNRLLNELPIELNKEVYKKSKEWMKTIIEETTPRNILCGGSIAYHYLKKVFPEFKKIDGNKDVIVGSINGSKVFFFKRRYSNIKNAKSLIKYMDMYLN